MTIFLKFSQISLKLLKNKFNKKKRKFKKVNQKLSANYASLKGQEILVASLPASVEVFLFNKPIFNGRI